VQLFLSNYLASTIAPTTTAPDWVLKLEEILAPIEAPVTLLYTVLDVALLIAAATLLLAFWTFLPVLADDRSGGIFALYSRYGV